jgi:hypothetical protein
MNSEYLGVDKEKQDMTSLRAEEENARSVGAGRTNACACKCRVTGGDVIYCSQNQTVS